MRISDWSSDVCSSDLPVRPYGLCLLVVRLRLQQADAVFGGGPGRSSHIALRRHEKGGRTDERDLRPSLPAAAHGPSLLHRPWAVGASGPGDVIGRAHFLTPVPNSPLVYPIHTDT